MQPAQRWIGRRHPKRLLRLDGDRAVVDLLSIVVAPGRVEDLADLCFADVACDDMIEQPSGVTASDEILVERGDVEQRRGVADRVILAVVRQLVGAGDDIAGPAPPGLSFGQRTGARMKRRGPQAQAAVGVSAGAKTTRIRSSAVIEWK